MLSLDGIPGELLSGERVQFTNIPLTPKWVDRLPRIISWVVKALLQFIWLLSIFLAAQPAPNAMLVQSPPAIPILAVCMLTAWLRGAKVVIDFHNLAYTLMRRQPSTAEDSLQGSKASILPSDSFMVRVAAAHERWVGCCCHAAITVTQAFSDWLGHEWGVKATVLHDKAPASFRPVTALQAHELMHAIRADLLRPHHGGAEFLSAEFSDERSPITTLQGTASRRAASWRGSPRPALLVSSTSWTPDEDFSMLLDAAQAYERQCCADKTTQHTRLVIVVTGKGPDKAAYLAKLANLHFDHVAIRTAWLVAEDYPKLLACADLGISLHASSSDLDLPMKVSDMLGSGTPVCGLRFKCAGEQIVEGRNGYLFSSASELTQIWCRLFAGTSSRSTDDRGRSPELQALCEAVASDRLTWEANWDCVVPDMLLRCMGLASAGNANVSESGLA